MSTFVGGKGSPRGILEGCLWFVCKSLKVLWAFCQWFLGSAGRSCGLFLEDAREFCVCFLGTLAFFLAQLTLPNLLSESNQAYNRGAQIKLGKQFCIYPLGPLLVGPEMISSHELSNPEHIPGTDWCIFCSAESCQHFIREKKKKCRALCDCFAQRFLRDLMDLNRCSLELILPKLAKENFTAWDTVYKSSFFRVP